MAIRMQQRRGTAQQWTDANPVLAAGEIGWESDTNKFKLGDGVNQWLDLDYFLNESQLEGSIDDFIPLTQKGSVNGVAELDGAGKVPSSQLPDIDELSQDAVNNALTAGTGITKNYDDNANTITLAVDTSTIATQSYVDTAVGNIDLSSKQDVVANVSSTEIGYLDGVTSSIQTQLDGKAASSHSHAIADVTDLQTTLDGKLSLSGGTMTGALTLAGAPANSNDAATKAYVDAVSEGLHIHPSCVAHTTANVDISTDLEPGDVVDGVTLAEGNRVLVKSQTNAAQNGIYVVQASGAALRASDFNEPQEVDGGDFVFVTGGTLGDNTGWVQTTTNVVTIGTDPIVFTQFSGAGTYQAGTGITLTDNVFSVDQSVIAPLAGPTFTGTVTLPSTTSIGDISSTELGYVNGVTSAIQTQLDGKAASSHTHAQSDVTNLSTDLAAKASLTGTETLTNKTLTSAILNGGTREGGTLDSGAFNGGTFSLANSTTFYYVLAAGEAQPVSFTWDSATSQTLDANMVDGQIITAVIITNGGYPSSVSVDGGSASIQTYWENSTAPAAVPEGQRGVFVFNIFKIGTNAFRIFASQSNFGTPE